MNEGKSGHAAAKRRRRRVPVDNAFVHQSVPLKVAVDTYTIAPNLTPPCAKIASWK
jgi:hypothetical protein